MKTRSKIGNKKGNPAYRTPSVFRSNKNQILQNINSRQNEKTRQPFGWKPKKLRD